MWDLQKFEHKLSNSNDYQELGRKNDFDNQELLNHLIGYLKKLTNCTRSIKNDEKTLYIKVIKYIKNIIKECDEVGLMKTESELANIKDKLIKKIKKVPNKARKSNNPYIEFLRRVTNDIEMIEIIAKNNIKEDISMVNTDFINYFLFENKNIDLAEEIIKDHTYLLNLYCSENENIINMVIDKYFTSLDGFLKEYNKKEDLLYYKDLISLLLNNNLIDKNINFDERYLQFNLDKISDYYNKESLTINEKKKTILWLNVLKNILTKKDPIPDIETLNHIYNVRFYFKKAILNEGELFALTNTPSNNKFLFTKRQFVSDYTITIDNEYTKDRDDAISVTKLNSDLYRLGIYIADPNDFCPFSSLMRIEARKRTQTLYLPDQNIYMFPEEYIHNYLSLDQDKYRLCRNYIYLVDKYGKVIDFRIEKGIIKVDVNLSYKKANKIIKSGSNIKELDTIFNDMLDITNILKNTYNYNNINNDEKYNSLAGISEDIIALLMVFNNNYVAKDFKNNNYPFVYRTHKLTSTIGKAFEEKFDILKEADENQYLAIIKELENIYLAANYSTTLSSHESLDLDEYGHTSSPLRRYADVLVNDCEDICYFSKPEDKKLYLFEDKLKEDVEYLNIRNKEIVEYYKSYSKVRQKSKID